MTRTRSSNNTCGRVPLFIKLRINRTLSCQSALSANSGQQSAVATVISTLLIVGLFSPLRRRVQAVIDRRFFRQKYDALQVLVAFALTARDETDLDSLNEELQRMIEQTLQPERVGVWLRSERIS